MEVCRGLERLLRQPDSVLTVGTFDGVHLGHQFIIDGVLNEAAKLGSLSTLVTFEPHPRSIIDGAEFAPKVLTTLDEKLEIFEHLRVQRVVVIEFTRAFSQTPSEFFVQEILFRQVGFRKIMVGYDHGFGKDRQGSLKTLRDARTQLGFEVEELPEFQLHDQPVKSTAIRQMLEEGQVDGAAESLGRTYRLSGTVVHGAGRGRNIGYPTANITPLSRTKLVPGSGVYAVRVHVGGEARGGMMNIGVRPTFGLQEQTIEVHIFDFKQDVYGEVLNIDLVKRVRPEMKFESSSHLETQLSHDKENVLQILNQ